MENMIVDAGPPGINQCLVWHGSMYKPTNVMGLNKDSTIIGDGFTNEL